MKSLLVGTALAVALLTAPGAIASGDPCNLLRNLALRRYPTTRHLHTFRRGRRR